MIMGVLRNVFQKFIELHNSSSEIIITLKLNIGTKCLKNYVSLTGGGNMPPSLWLMDLTPLTVTMSRKSTIDICTHTLKLL